MSALDEIRIAPRSLDRLAEVVERGEVDALRRAERDARERLVGRAVWNLNSTAVGGGVAEMLRPLLAYSRGAGIDARWAVVHGSPAFFLLTKRLHHALHGSRGDGRPLDDAAHALYEQTLRPAGLELAARVRPGDVVILHDPQTAGIAPTLARSGVHVIWRCHIGADASGPEVDRGWAFLGRYLDHAVAFVFSRDAYVPDRLDHGRSHVIAPSIDAFSAKNEPLEPSTVRAILVHAGLLEGPPPEGADCGFVRMDGTPGRVGRSADVMRLGRAPAAETPLVVQVSRWDPLKDPIGVVRGFEAMLVAPDAPAAELVLAGPGVHAVADDPEAAAVLDAVEATWRALSPALRKRVHLASLPTADVEENAAIVNALQRHAAVVVQKSLHEGFGLTVTEAMWKARPVLASAVGGIRDQIEHGVHGLLLRDPSDPEEFAGALRRLLEDAPLARRLGEAARERVRERYLGFRHLAQYARLIERLDEKSPLATKPEDKMDLHEEMDQLRALRDEVRLQLELGKAEARERFAPLEERFGRLEAKLRELRETGREELEDVRAAARLLMDEIREGYEHLRARL